MIDSIKITQNPNRTKYRAQYQQRQLTLGNSRYLFFTEQQYQSKDSSNQIPEKLFCTLGRSPASRTQTFITAKQKADINIQTIPFVYAFIAFNSFLVLSDSTIPLSSSFGKKNAGKQRFYVCFRHIEIVIIQLSSL